MVSVTTLLALTLSTVFGFVAYLHGVVRLMRVQYLHATAAWMIWGLWPFSRLVHAWSYPLWYLWRPYIVYRSRRPAPPAEPGTGGRKWRKIGAPY